MLQTLDYILTCTCWDETVIGDDDNWFVDEDDFSYIVNELHYQNKSLLIRDSLKDFFYAIDPITGDGKIICRDSFDLRNRDFIKKYNDSEQLEIFTSASMPPMPFKDSIIIFDSILRFKNKYHLVVGNYLYQVTKNNKIQNASCLFLTKFVYDSRNGKRLYFTFNNSNVVFVCYFIYDSSHKKQFCSTFFIDYHNQIIKK